VRAALVLLGLLLATACDDNTPATDPDPQADENNAAPDCLARCVRKATLCGSPDGFARASCEDICALRPTETQLRCVELIECSRLAAAFGDATTLCQIGPGWVHCRPGYAPDAGCPGICDAPDLELDGGIYCTAVCSPKGECPPGHFCRSGDPPVCLPR